MKIMTVLSNVWSFVRKIYSLPGVAQVFDKLVIEYLQGRADSSKNTVDDKIVKALSAALANKNYRAVLNGRAKKS